MENERGRDDGMVTEVPDLGGAGDTDDLVVVGMVGTVGGDGDDGGIGVIGTDNGMTHQPRRRPAPEAQPSPDQTERRPQPTPAEKEPKGRKGRGHKAIDGTVATVSEGIPADADKAHAKKGRGTELAKKGMSVAAKVAIAVLVVLVGALVGIWAYGRAHFSEHLFPGRTVDGVNVSDMTAKEATEATSVDRWSFVIDDMGQKYELGAEDVGFSTEEIDFAEIIKKQDVNLWFIHVIAPETNEAIRKSTYDSDAVHDSVKALPCVSGEREAPVDAEVKKAEDGKSFTIVPEEEGNTVDASIIEDAIEEALATGQSGSINLKAADAYIHPLVYSTDESMKSAVDTANKWMRTNITYDIDGLESVVTLGPETISQWVNIEKRDPEPKNEEKKDDEPDEKSEDKKGDKKDDKSEDGSAIQVFGRVSPEDSGMLHQVSETVPADKKDDRAKPTFEATFNDDGLREWLAGIGEEYDTAGKPKTITTPNGEVKQVSGGGSYGWITDEATEFDAVKESVEKGETVHREFATKQRAALPKGQNEWGNTYIEIDLTDQHLWYIRNGEVVLSYGVITGKSGYETPTMVSQVYAKQTDVELISPWKDPVTGEPTYKTHIDVGLVISDDYQVLCHDAPWQPSYGFGSSSYHWSGGSHGCCNMRASDCWTLYETASVGDPVIVHY